MEPMFVDNVEPSHLVADPVRNRLYVTVDGGASAFANELVVIDPSVGMVVHSVFVGSNPSALAISDDGTTLWVGLDGSYEIRAIALEGNDISPGDAYALPLGDPVEEPATAGKLVVLPGAPETVAVSLLRSGSPGFAGAAVLDSGIARPERTPGHTGASRLTLGPEGWLFGYNDEHTGFGFYAMQVSPTGITQTEHPSLVSGFNTDITYAEGRVYATSGHVVDVSDPSDPRAAGKFAHAGAVLPLPQQAMVVMLSPAEPNEGVSNLRNFNPETFTESSAPVPVGLDVHKYHDLVTADGETLAVVAYDGFFDDPPQLALLNNPF